MSLQSTYIYGFNLSRGLGNRAGPWSTLNPLVSVGLRVKKEHQWPAVGAGNPQYRWWHWWWSCCPSESSGSSGNLKITKSNISTLNTISTHTTICTKMLIAEFKPPQIESRNQQIYTCWRNSPLLWPSQSSWRKRKRSQVNSSSAITFSSVEGTREMEMNAHKNTYFHIK